MPTQTSKGGASKHLKEQVKGALRPILVSGIYIILFVSLHAFTDRLQLFAEISPWKLTAGLNLGLLLAYGLEYLPVVFASQALSAWWTDSVELSEVQVFVSTASLSAVYALSVAGIRRLTAEPHIDLASRKDLSTFFLMAPSTAAALAAVAVAHGFLAGLISWEHVMDTALCGAVGNTVGIVLVVPLFLLGRGWLDGLMSSVGGNHPAAGTKTIKECAGIWQIGLLSVLLAVLLYFVFGWVTPDAFLLFCLISVPLIVLALQFGLQGTAVFLVVVGLVGMFKAEPRDGRDVWVPLVVILSSVEAIIVASLVSERRHQCKTIDHQTGLLNSVSFAVEHLLATADQEESINEILRHLASQAKVTRIYVLENGHAVGSSDCPVRYEFASPNTFLDKDSTELLNVIRSRQVRVYSDLLAHGEPVQHRAVELSPEEQAILSGLGIRVAIILPIFAEGRWWGCLGLDQCSTDRLWSDAEIKAFKATARTLGALLAHTNVEQQFRQFTGNIPAVFWIASPNGLQRIYVSPAYEQIWGRPCESVQDKPESWIGSIYHEDYPRVRVALDQQMVGKYDEQYRIVRPDRSVRWIRDTAFPVRDASGQVNRIVGIAQDITPQKEAEERVRATSLLLSTLIDNLQVGIVVEDHARRVMHVNQAFCGMFEVAAPQQSLVGVDSRLVMAQKQPYAKRSDQIIREGEPCRGEEVMTDDSRIFSRDYIPLSVDGDCHYHLWQYEDITERRRSEEQIRASLKEKEVLLKEIHHRVKNNLQVISSLLNLQAMQIRDDQAAQVFRDSQSRVKAMALVHERLYQSADLARIDFGGYVRDVTTHLLRSYQIGPRGVRLSLEVDPVSLNIDTAIPCALIINELVSNSMKYAFPNGRGGEIRIRLVQCSNENLNLAISDNGVGFPQGVSFETTDSLGLQLVRNLADQLNGTVTYRCDNGTEFDITFRPVINESRN